MLNNLLLSTIEAEYNYFHFPFLTIALGSLIVSLIVNYFFFKNVYKEEGWKGVIPFYVTYVQFQKTFGETRGWLFLLTALPAVGWIYQIYFLHNFAKSLNKGFGWTLLLAIFPIIPFAILAFSKDVKYVGPQKHFGLD